jgi:hypothetical protein
LRTATEIAVKHVVYNNAKNDGEEVSWDDIVTDEFENAYMITDKDSILLIKPSDDVKDKDGRKVNDLKQLKDQRIAYAAANNFHGYGDIKQEDYPNSITLPTSLSICSSFRRHLINIWYQLLLLGLLSWHLLVSLGSFLLTGPIREERSYAE